MTEAWPDGSEAWFVCRAGGIVDDIMMRLKPGVTASEHEIYKRHRATAARVFKRRHGIHPCTRVDVEMQGVGVIDD